jgi:hypothetical protein
MKVYAIFLILLFPVNSLANLEVDGEFHVGTNNNVSNAVSVQDIFSDQFTTANLRIGKLWVPEPGRSVLLRSHLGVQRFTDSDGLNRKSLGGSVTYIHRVGLGAYAPRFTVGAHADYRDYKVAARDGWLFRFSAGWQKRFIAELDGVITVAHERRTADMDKAIPLFATAPKDVFNQTNNEITAALNYAVMIETTLAVSYRYRQGEADSSTNPGSAYVPIAKGKALDGALCQSCERYIAYLVDVKSHSVSLNLNRSLGRDTSIGANFERRIAQIEGDITYTVNLFTLELIGRF